VLLAGAWAWRGDQAQEAPAAERKLVQLTADPGLSAWPDITADGNIVVYSSDRDGGPDLDLWLRYVDRDEALQITDEPGDEIEASISPDGSLISYTSLPSESILTVPTLGGTPRLIAKKGKFPQFSPDGKSIAFSRGRSGWSNDLVIHVLDTGRQTVYGESMNWLGNGVLWLPDGTLLSGGIKAGNPTGGPCRSMVRRPSAPRTADWGSFRSVARRLSQPKPG
jgi:Tol biopolymer transport system component